VLWPTEGEGRQGERKGIPKRRKGKERRNREGGREGGGGRREQKLTADIDM